VTVNSKRPINLLELRATYTTGGGPDKTILLSAEKHNKDVVNPIVVYLKDIRDNNFQIGRMAEGRGFTYIEVLDRGKVDFKCITELNRIVRDYDIDIIHGHDYKTDILAYVLGLCNPHVHLISTSHGWITNTLKGSLYKWIHLRVLRRFKNLIAVSEATKSMMSASGITSKKIKVIYNGIDCNYWCFNGQKPTLKKEWNIPDNAFVIGTVGRISDEKDYITFLKIAKTVTDKINNVYFVIVGEGKQNERERLVEFADTLDIRDKIVFAGYRSDLLEVYSTCDIFLMTSITEGLPNTMLEAMSMGVSIVSTNVGGIPELVEEGKTGFLFDIGNTANLAEKIIYMITNRALRESLSTAGRERIEKVFSFDRRLHIIEKYYADIYAADTSKRGDNNTCTC
jgi:glycosyltransferase involved in cell wall biosynthesis